MSDNSFFGNIFKVNDPDLNIPVTGTGVLSPYLNLDPRLLQQDAEEYILPEGAGHQRGRFEKAFAQIGGAVILGSVLGAANGITTGFKETKSLTGSIKRTQLLNFITKQGASTSKTFGVIALMYSIFGVVLSLSRGKDDDLNTLIAGTATGLAFKSSAGIHKCLGGGAVGLSVAVAAIFCYPKFKDMMKK